MASIFLSRLLCTLALGLAAFSGGAAAQAAYPSRPIRFIVPFPPGGLTDVFIRALANEMQKSIGQPLIVDNRPGANQIIGADACAKSAPDGYTLCLIGTDTNSFNPYLFAKLPYSAEKDFSPVAPLFFLVEGVMATSTVKADSITELVSLSKQRPELLNYGSFGQGSALQLFMEWFKHTTGANAAHIPYKGGAPLVQALLTGETQLVHFGLGNVSEHLKSGKLKLLAVSSSARSPLFPSVPTLAESGIGTWPSRSWFGVAAPAGTPRETVEKLNVEINRVLATPEFQKTRLMEQSLEARPMSPTQFSEFLVSDRRNAAAIVKISGVVPQ